jgi:hypothetical protein
LISGLSFCIILKNAGSNLNCIGGLCKAKESAYPCEEIKVTVNAAFQSPRGDAIIVCWDMDSPPVLPFKLKNVVTVSVSLYFPNTRSLFDLIENNFIKISNPLLGKPIVEIQFC